MKRQHSPITAKQLNHLGQLSQLDLSKEEVAGFTPEIENILTYVDALKQVPIEKHELAYYAIDTTNVFSADDARSSRTLAIDDAMANAPKQSDGMFLVPTVRDAK